MRFGSPSLTYELDSELPQPIALHSNLMNQPCTIVLRTTSASVDAYGNETYTSTTVDTVCDIQQRRRDEPGEQGEFSITLWDGFFPTDTTLDTGDSVIVPGKGTFEVVGAPWDADQGVSSFVNHVEATLKLTA